jgi:tRNA (guanine-N7-)-methyltransferase
MEETRKRILYGRRKGKPLRKNQQIAVEELLPQLTVPLDEGPINLERLFGADVSQYWLEIGFGGGEHLAWQAANHPEAGIIGCEPFINGIAMLLAKLKADSIENVRVHNDAAEHLLENLPEASLDKAFLLFADPWPKKSHHKRRFVTDANISAVGRVLKDNSILRVGTDHTDYGAWILHHFLRSKDFVWEVEKPQNWLARGDDWPQTRYEAKAEREGRKSVYYRFRRVARS